jgi:DeoR/GlpR family transcriptional regulator of sugar metabolism
MIKDLHADHCFLTTVGIDAGVGATTLDILEAQLNARMIGCAREVTVLADSSKFGHRSLSVIADIGLIHRIITDDRVAPEAIEPFQDKGIEVILV